MKFFTAITSALAFTTAIAAPFAVNAPETNSLEERDIPISNPGIHVYHSREQMANGRFRSRFRMIGFIQVTGAMMDVLTERMGASSSTDQPVQRASIVAQAFFAHFRSWLSSEFPFRNFDSMRALFNAGGSGDAKWAGTIGAQFETFGRTDYNRMMDAIRAYLTSRGSDAVKVVFESVPDAFAVGNPTEYTMPSSKLKARSANTCSSTTSVISMFQNTAPGLPSYFGPEC